MQEEMSIELAQQLVEHRIQTTDTWKETVRKLAPNMYVNSVRSYVNKYLNGKVKVRREQIAAPVNKAIINYHILTRSWL